MAESTLTKTRIIAELTKSPHGKLEQYVPVGAEAAKADPEFFAHLVAWTALKSEVRDATVALPVLAAVHAPSAEPFGENALAHLAALDPRSFARALEFGRTVKFHGRVLRRLVTRYLRDLEGAPRPKLEHVLLQHKSVLKRLYALYHVKPSDFINAVVLQNKPPSGTVFDIVRRLGDMDPVEAAGHIVGKRIPFLIAAGALKDKMKSPDVVLALIQRMSPTELVTNTKRLEKLGVRTEPALRAAFEEALTKAGASKKRGKTTLKASVAADALEEGGDDVLAAKLRALQEKQLEKLSIEGSWLVLGDKSGSMATAIETARQIAAVLSRCVAGRVHLVFFDVSPRHIDVTGKTLDEITKLTQHVTAAGGTSIGCGLLWALEKNVEVDGIVIISDGAENSPPVFAHVYQQYSKAFGGKIPPVYFYRLSGDYQGDVLASNCRALHIDVQEFDLRGGVDFYSLPSLVQTMRTTRYSLVDEVHEVPLLRIDDVLTRTKGTPVYARTTEAHQL